MYPHPDPGMDPRSEFWVGVRVRSDLINMFSIPDPIPDATPEPEPDSIAAYFESKSHDGNVWSIAVASHSRANTSTGL